MKPTRKKKPHAKSKEKLEEDRQRDAAKKKPDPSPLKKPDPTANTQSDVSSTRQTKKKKSSVKSIISSALKRSKSDQSKKRDAKVISSADEAVIAINPSVNHSSPPSDMDTACSTPEKESPLITSPHEKPDPPTRSIAVAVAARKQSQKQKEPRAKEPEPDAVYRQMVAAEQEKKRPGQCCFVFFCA